MGTTPVIQDNQIDPFVFGSAYNAVAPLLYEARLPAQVRVPEPVPHRARGLDLAAVGSVSHTLNQTTLLERIQNAKRSRATQTCSVCQIRQAQDLSLNPECAKQVAGPLYRFNEVALLP
jgi:hypothetical protein